MNKLFVVVLLTATALLASCATSGSSEKKDTYTMQKGGMSSQAHEMPATEKSDEDTATKRKDGYRMEKGPMGNVGHEMK